MAKLFHPFWFFFTTGLTLVFLIMFPLAIIDQQGLFNTVLYSLLGVVVIWTVYIARALIYSKISPNVDHNDAIND